MAMDGFGTSTEEMGRAGAHVLSVDSEVQAELRTLQSRLAPLAGAWTGDAATRFAQLMQRWDADAQALNVALRGIGEAVQATGTAYQAQEDERAAQMNAITAALG